MGPLGDIIRGHGISYMCYADDTQLYVGLQDTDQTSMAIHRLELCLSDIRHWMLQNKLKLNDSKTEVIRFSSRYRNTLEFPGVTVGDTVILPRDDVRNLGMMLDSNLTMDSHIKQVTCSALSSIRYIGRLRKFLDRPALEKLLHYLQNRLRQRPVDGTPGSTLKENPTSPKYCCPTSQWCEETRAHHSSFMPTSLAPSQTTGSIQNSPPRPQVSSEQSPAIHVKYVIHKSTYTILTLKLQRLCPIRPKDKDPHLRGQSVLQLRPCAMEQTALGDFQLHQSEHF